jgi:hypothetical protein
MYAVTKGGKKINGNVWNWALEKLGMKTTEFKWNINEKDAYEVMWVL